MILRTRLNIFTRACLYSDLSVQPLRRAFRKPFEGCSVSRRTLRYTASACCMSSMLGILPFFGLVTMSLRRLGTVTASSQREFAEEFAQEPHIPVLLDEVIAYYADVNLRTYVDGTLGAGDPLNPSKKCRLDK